MIRVKKYVDIDDFDEPSQEAYKEFVRDCGINNGEHWSFEVGEKGDDSTVASYIGQDKTDLISENLRKFGSKDGDVIDLVFEW